MNNGHQQGTLRDWALRVYAGWPALAACMLLGLAIGGIATVGQPSQFRAHGSIVLSSSNGFLDPHNAQLVAKEVGPTAAYLAASPAVLSDTSSRFTGSAATAVETVRRRRIATLSWVADHFGAGATSDSSVIQVTATGRSGAEARDLARAGLLALTRAIARGQFLRGGRSGERTSAPFGIRTRTFGVPDSATQVTPRPRANLLVGLNVGLLLGLPAALLMSTSRRRERRGTPVAVGASGGPALHRKVR